MAHIDYYLFGQSPFTFLGHRALKEMADRHGAAVALKPVILHDLWANSGARPTPEQPGIRQRYERIELQRVARERGIAINLQPRYFPIDISLADRCAIAIAENSDDAFDYVESVGRGVWCDEADLGDEAEIGRRLVAAGHDAAMVLDLVVPARHSASISVKLMQELGGATVLGPILTGIAKPVQIASTGMGVADILNMAAIAARDTA